MDKRYQVFVSSTYADLKEERQHVIQTLMEMDCIPAGMELFPAMDEEQWEFIKKVIDDCDYYLLVIGGRYGSTTEEGISYTEMEFNYAIQKGLKVIALVHDEPNKLPGDKIELESGLRTRLEEFRAKVLTGRLVKFWQIAEQLPGLVSLSLQKTIKTYPAIGWVRGDQVAGEKLLSEINELRKENIKLQRELDDYRTGDSNKIKNLAGLEDTFSLKIESPHENYFELNGIDLVHELTWREIFLMVGGTLFNRVRLRVQDLRRTLIFHVLEKYDVDDDAVTSLKLNYDDFNVVVHQLMALGLIEFDEGGQSKSSGVHNRYVKLTVAGNSTYLESKAIKRD